ncbi:MAG: glycosyltransferase family 4 protein [Lachnospiraceae bacterium]|nr:glycosyltransferase family 4 protein [Lachnospiraceae bacterium]
MLEFLDHKNVLFITTKNLDYIRNSQELRLIRERAASCAVIGSGQKSYAKRLFSVYRKLLFTSMKPYDLVFVGFAPQLVVPFFRRLRKRELAIDFFISMYDTLVWDRKKLKDGSLPARLLKGLDRKTLALADEIVADTKAHGAYFAEELGAAAGKLHTLYLEADASIYYPREQKKEGGFEDRFVVLYFGSVLPLQGVPVILEAMERLRMREDIFFYMIGPLGGQVKKPDTFHVRYIPWLSQEALAEAVAGADLCLAGHFHGTIGKAKRTIPGKAYIYRAMGKPMILGDNEANRELYREGDGRTHFVEMGNAEALADKIAALADDWKRQRNGE